MAVADLSMLADQSVAVTSLIVGGGLSILLAIYGRRDDSYWDEIGTFFAFVIGIAMLAIAVASISQKTLGWFSIVLMILLASGLFLKPLKDIPLAAIAGVVCASAVAIACWFFLPDTVLGYEKWLVVTVLFFVVGAFVHITLHLAGSALLMSAKVVSWKPVMILVALLSVAEGAAIALLDESLFSLL